MNENKALTIEDNFYSKFDKDIYIYTTDIQNTVDSWANERALVLAKLQEIANAAYTKQQPVIKCFGSLETGIALETSDMDMAVTGLSINDRYEMIDEMHKLSNGLGKWDLVSDLKAIDTASIPVIKAVSFFAFFISILEC
jgi:DNA polymerase sigma